MPKVFVSYRRIDSQERTHRIADWLVLKYGIKNVFIDIDRIEGATDFADSIAQSLDESDVLIVVIGDQWVDEMERRAQLPDFDFVRFEVSKGLQDKLKIIPILLEREIYIDPNRLPDDVREIVKLNYMYARSTDFHKDMDEVKRIIDEATRKPWRRTLLLVMTTFFLTLMTFFVLFNMFIPKTPPIIVTATATPKNLETEAVMLSTRQNLPTATVTPNKTQTLASLIMDIQNTAIAAYTETPSPTVTPTFTPSNTATATPNIERTVEKVATENQMETQAVQALTQQSNTQIAQLTANAPTNTPNPTHTPSYTPTVTSSPSPTLTGTPTLNLLATAQIFLEETLTQEAITTQIFEAAVATEQAITLLTATQDVLNTLDANKDATANAFSTSIREKQTATAEAKQHATQDVLNTLDANKDATANFIATSVREKQTATAEAKQYATSAVATQITAPYEIVIQDDFDASYLNSIIWANWYSRDVLTVEDGQVHLEGNSSWNESLDTRSRLRENDGFIILFQYKHGDMVMHLTYGDWASSANRGVGIQSYSSGDLWEIRRVVGPNGRTYVTYPNNVRLSTDTWYYLMVIIEDDGSFTYRIWEPDDPTTLLLNTNIKPPEDGWDDQSWGFSCQVYSGALIIDQFTHIRFTDS